VQKDIKTEYDKRKDRNEEMWKRKLELTNNVFKNILDRQKSDFMNRLLRDEAAQKLWNVKKARNEADECEHTYTGLCATQGTCQNYGFPAFFAM